jgi:hypothetical protein
METITQKHYARLQTCVVDRVDYEGLELLHDDWRVVMKEAARAGLKELAYMAEKRCDQLLAEIACRNELGIDL